MTPPEPTRIRPVIDAARAVKTSGAVLPMPGMLWCSAYHSARSPTHRLPRKRVCALQRGLGGLVAGDWHHVEQEMGTSSIRAER
jgi:hypothetical protein